MRILHVITMLDIGGAERLMVDLLPLLRNKGHDVDLLLLDGVETLFKEEIKQKGIRVFELSRGTDVDDLSNVYSPWNIFKIRKYIGDYDIIHTHNTASQFFVPLSRIMTSSKTILVTTEHNSTNRRRDIWWFKPIDKWMYTKYNAIVCISDQTKNNLEQYLGRNDGIVTIYNGVNVQRFIQPLKDISRNDSFIITMVAAFRDQKDHETVIRAMRSLPSNYHLQFVGGGETDRVNTLKKMCYELGLDNRIDFMGKRRDVPEIMKNSDITVLSSHWEGFGLVAVESMAAGRPLIATDVGGLREVVIGAGLLFPHGDYEDLAKKIQELCNNPDLYRRVASRCQERARQYDISAMVDGYDNLYKMLMGVH